MTAQERIAQLIGGLHMQVAGLSEANEQLVARVAELEKEKKDAGLAAEIARADRQFRVNPPSQGNGHAAGEHPGDAERTDQAAI